MHNDHPPSSASASAPRNHPPKSEHVPSQPLPASDVLAARPAPLHPAQTPQEWPEYQRRMSYPGPSRTTTAQMPTQRPLSMHAPPSQPRSPFRLPQMHPQPPRPPPTYNPPWTADQAPTLPPVSELVREGMQFPQDEPRLIAPTVPGAHRMWIGATAYDAPPHAERQQQRVERPEPQRLFPLFHRPPPQPIAPMPLPITRAPPTPPSQTPQEPIVPPRPLIFPQRRPQGRQGGAIPRGEGGVRKRVLQHACNQCSYRAHQSSDLKRHLATHEDLRPFRCPSCERRFRQKAHLNAHRLAIHSKLKPHKCDVCTRTFAARSSLKRHVTYVHNRNPPYFCPNCPAQFQRVFDRNRHQATVHGDAGPPAPGGPSQMQLQQQQQQAIQIQHQQQMQQTMHQTDPRFGYEPHAQQHPPQQHPQQPQQMQHPSQVQGLQQLQLPRQFMQLQLRPPGQPRASSSGLPPSPSQPRDPLPPPPPAPPPPPPREGNNGQ